MIQQAPAALDSLDAAPLVRWISRVRVRRLKPLERLSALLDFHSRDIRETRNGREHFAMRVREREHGYPHDADMVRFAPERGMND